MKRQQREMTPAEARAAVRNGTLRRRSLAELDEVISEIAANTPKGWHDALDAIIAGKKGTAR